MSRHSSPKPSLSAPHGSGTSLSEKTKLQNDDSDQGTFAVAHGEDAEKNATHTGSEAEAEAGAEQEDDESSQHLHGFRLAAVITGACLGVLCTGLDYAIIATAIPRITDSFESINDVGWYGSAYFLTACAFQLFYGKLYVFFPRKWVFTLALIIFEVGNVVCGAAPSSTAFIVGRAIAGFGSAGIFSGALLLVAHSMPLQKRPPFLGLIQSMNGLASVLGPVIGGAITDNKSLTWRWCFYINLPVGGATLAFIFFFYPGVPAMQTLNKNSWRTQLRQFDPFGTLTFVPMIICLLLVLQWGGSQYPWSDGRIIALWVLFGVLLIAFVAIQIWEQDNAILPPRVLMQRTVGGCVLFTLLQAAAMFAMLYYLPVWFQAIKGSSAIESGYRTLPMGISIVLVSITTASLPALIGYYTQFIWISSILMAVGAGLISTFHVNTSTGEWIGYQILFGIGIGFGISVTNVAIQTVLPISLIPAGTALNMFCQMAGGAVFISVAQNVFQNGLLRYVLTTVPDLSPTDVISAGATELVTRFPQYLGPVRIAYNKALIDAFYTAVATSTATIVGTIFVEWKSVKHVGAPPETQSSETQS